jgi:hypothetical protein
MEMIPCGSTVAFSLTVIVPSSICVSPSGDHILLAGGEETRQNAKTVWTGIRRAI